MLSVRAWKISRREFLKFLGAGAIILTLGLFHKRVSGFGLVKDGQGATSKVYEEIYKGKRIVIDESIVDQPRLFVNGKPIYVELGARENEYWTNLAPFIIFEGPLIELAKGLIDIGVA
jgi:hypothetical protein